MNRLTKPAGSMLLKALIILLLCAVIALGTAYFGYDIFLKPKRLARAEKNEPPPPPPPDPTLPEFEKTMAVRQSGNLLEARTALEHFLENYSYSSKVEEAQTALGEVNVGLFFSSTMTPEKVAYVIKPGDVLNKIERKLKAPAELIMRTNNLTDATKLRIGDVLYVSNPKFSLVISRKEKTITLLNDGKFFKKYRAIGWYIPPTKSPAPINAKVSVKDAWRNGQRVAFGSKEFNGSARWIVTSAPHYTIYAEPEADSAPAEKPPNGISLDRAEAEELSTLLSLKTPVLIQ